MEQTRNSLDPSANEPDSRAEVDPDVADLLGLRPADAGSIPDVDELDDVGEITDTRIYEGELEARPVDSDQPDRSAAESLESLTSSEPRAGETDDPYEAAEEGLTWIAPTDPPVRPGPNGDPEVAAGFGTTADDEPFDADHHAESIGDADERTARVLEALRADAATSGLADQLVVEMDGGLVVIRGTVEDLEDEDAVTAVVESVPGVTEVRSRIEIRALKAIEERA
jgi:BON domain-containing protein